MGEQIFRGRASDGTAVEIKFEGPNAVNIRLDLDGDRKADIEVNADANAKGYGIRQRGFGHDLNMGDARAIYILNKARDAVRDVTNMHGNNGRFEVAQADEIVQAVGALTSAPISMTKTSAMDGR